MCKVTEAFVNRNSDALNDLASLSAVMSLLLEAQGLIDDTNSDHKSFDEVAGHITRARGELLEAFQVAKKGVLI